jgi:hypothetical protein
MRLAWFRPATHVSDRLDDTAALVKALGSEHEIEIVDEARAHDFVRRDFRTPFDLCVFELADTSQHAFVWPYLLHVPGVLRLRSLSLHESRTVALRRQHRQRDYDAELAFGDWELTAAPVLASRTTVVSDLHAAARLRRVYPTARIRLAPIGLGSDPLHGATRPSRGQGWGQSQGRSQSPDQGQDRGRGAAQTPSVGSLDGSRSDIVQRAFARARRTGARLELITGPPDVILDTADVVVATSWPPPDELTIALAGMAASRAVVVLETESTAGWPALDPQTWQPRGWTGERPIVVSVDPRDEEHSLSLALRRLASDAALRNALGSAAHDWWQQHATLDHAVRAWRSILAEAVTLTPLPRPANWPRHLSADGTERARELLGEIGAAVDFLS